MKVRRWLPPLLWAGVIIFATSMPAGSVPQRISTFDKTAHFSMYAILAALLTREISEVTGQWQAAILAIGVSVTFGAVDEWHQQFIPGRSTELADWQADSLGAAAGALLFALFRSSRSRTLTSR